MLTQEQDLIIISLHISQGNAQEEIIIAQRESSVLWTGFFFFSLVFSFNNELSKCKQ